MIHKTVLLQETIESLSLKKGDIVVDCTLGSGGHSEAVCATDLGITLVGIDADADALRRSSERLKGKPCEVKLTQANFANLQQVLDDFNYPKVDKYIFDLGWSSDQLEASGRGFSFLRDEPLVMTLKEDMDERTLIARDIVNEWQEENIADIIYGYGEERYSRRIAKRIVETRREKSIETTFELVDIIKASVPAAYRKGRLHPATRTFQALRITVNNEIENLKKALSMAKDRLNPMGRIAVISFHSLEDRIVKHLFRDFAEKEEGKVVTKKPIVPTEEELLENPRARSAKLRVFEKN